jgi:hypothetical protein
VGTDARFEDQGAAHSRMALARTVEHMGSGLSDEDDGQSVSRIQLPGPLVPTLRRVDGENSGGYRSE